MGFRVERLVSVRWVFLAAVVILGILVFYEPLAQKIPAGLVDLLRRNSEAYLFSVLMILDVEVVAPPEGRTRRPVWWLWLAVLGVAWSITYVWGETLGLAQALITLNEAFAAVILISVYLRWSRGPSGGRPVVRRQMIFYGAMLTLPILGEILSGTSADRFAVRIIDNAEVFGLTIVVGFLFDAVEKWPSGHGWRGWRRLGFYAFLLVVPALYTAYNLPRAEIGDAVQLIDSAFAWLQRVTEAFVAALIISIFYELSRRWPVDLGARG